MSKGRKIALLLSLLIFLLASFLGIITAVQIRQYHLGQELVRILINSNGSIDLFYNISITLDSGPDISYVLVGQPKGDFTINDATDQFGNTLSTNDASSGSDYKVRVSLASPPAAGQTVWFTLTTNVAHMIYEESQTNVGLQFTPTWWPEATVADLSVFIVLPLGVTSSQIGASVNWDNLSTEPDGRFAVFWERQNLAPNQQYNFGVTFPKEYVQVYEGIRRVHNLNTRLNYTSIQEAINANETLNYHVILVDAGMYDERVIINKSISLVGENKENTILNWTVQSWDTAVLDITADDVKVAQFSILGWAGVKIMAVSCSNTTISDNVIQSTGVCISLNGSNNCTITANRVLGGGLEGNDLIVLSYSSGCLVENNTVEGACYAGIRLDSSSRNLIRNNLIHGDGTGMYVSAVDNVIFNNTISMCGSSGIEFDLGSNGNTVSSNVISDCWNGIRFQYWSYGNIILGNNFESNVDQVYGSPTRSYFNESSEGNYWSDYNGTDANQDGIGDTPYVAEYSPNSFANVDYYPLAGRHYSFAVFTLTTGFQPVTVISNSTVSSLSLDYVVPTNDYVQSDQPFIKFLVTGQNGTVGFSRLMIPKAVMNSSSYIVFVNNKQVNVTQLPNSNNLYAYLYFTYVHSTRQILVFVPEFPSFLVLLLFMIATLLAVVAYKRRHLTCAL